MSTETPSERHARILSDYDHNHSTDGSFFSLGETQDGSIPGCPDCGRRTTIRSDPWRHALDCPSYSPHPNSIAFAKLHGEATA